MLHSNSNGPSFNKTDLTKQTVVVLFGEFAGQNEQFIEDVATMKANMLPNGKLGQAIDYFSEASQNQFTLNFVFAQQTPFRSTKDLIHFSNQSLFDGEIEFCKKLIQKTKAEIAKAIQDNQLSSNPAEVPLLVIHSAEDDTSGLTSLKYKSQEDPKHPYALCSINSLPGTYCHELGHLLFNWPDLYDSHDLDESGNTINGVTSGLGDWCLMARGIGQPPEKFTGPSGWVKYCQKWLQASDLTDGSHTLKLGSLARILISGSEYLFLENREKKGIDSEIPKQGLLVYHIDETAPGFHSAFPNHDELYPGIKLYQADGLEDLNYGSPGDAMDPYPAEDLSVSASQTFNNSLTDFTTPCINRNSGELSGKRIENIRLIQSSGDIEFELKSSQLNTQTSASQIVEVNGNLQSVSGGPGADAISATKIREAGQNSDWLVVAELSNIIATYKIDGQGNASRSTTTTKEVFSKDVLLRPFDFKSKNYLLVYDPYNGNVEFFQMQNGALIWTGGLDADATRYRRYMYLATGEFVWNGIPQFAGLDPFKGLLDFYYVDEDANQNLNLYWLESHDVNAKVADQARWSSMASGNFDSGTGLDELCFYNLRKFDNPHMHEILLFQTYPLYRNDYEEFDRTQTGVPVRFDHICSGNFFTTNSHQSIDLDGLALLASEVGHQKVVFRDTKNPAAKKTVPLSGEWSWMVSGNFLGNASDQVLLHRR